MKLSTTAHLVGEQGIDVRAALDVVRRAGAWVRQNGRRMADLVEQSNSGGINPDARADGNAIDDFLFTLEPLFAELVNGYSRSAWCAAGLRISYQPTDVEGRVSSTSGFNFRYLGRSDVVWENGVPDGGERPAWRIAELMGRLSRRCHVPPFETLLTTDLCINVLKDNRPLIVSTRRLVAPKASQARVVLVDSLYDLVRQRTDAVRELLIQVYSERNESDQEKAFLAIDSELATVLRALGEEYIKIEGIMADDDLLVPLRHELARGKIPGLALAKYITLMTVLWPNWTRICMLPYIGPFSANSQPGGLVICEDQPLEACLSTEDLDIAADIASAAMWPWLAVRAKAEGRREGKSEARNEARRFTQRILDRLDVLENDYSNAEVLFQRGKIRLVDFGDYYGTLSLPEDARQIFLREKHVRYAHFLRNEAGKKLTIIMPVLGNRNVCFESLKSIARQSYLEERGENVEIILIQDGDAKNPDDDPISPELFDLIRQYFGHVKFRMFRLKKNRGRATARNVGIHYAKNDIILFVDSSMILEKNFLTDHMMRHERIEHIALLGFKENISWESYNERKEGIFSGTIVPNFRYDLKWAHVLRPEEAGFEYAGRFYNAGDQISYMELTNNFNGWRGLDAIGHRTLATFFQTNIVSVERSIVRKIGGFDPSFDTLWGFEDSFMGALLIAHSQQVKLVPCPSSVAFKIEHSEERTKYFDIAENREQFKERLNFTPQNFSERKLKEAIKNLVHKGLLSEESAGGK